MPTVTIAGRTSYVPALPRRPRMTLRSSEGGKALLIPFAPVQIDHDGYGWSWQAVERAGRLPLLLRTTRNPRTISFRLTIANNPGGSVNQSIDPLLKAIAQLADSGDAVTIAYSRAEGGRWRLLSCPYTVTARKEDNTPSRADMTMTFQWASDVPRQLGRTKKKPAPSKGSSSKASSPGKKKATVRSYTVRPGDTLRGIARKVYGDGDRWQAIARANGIKNARRLVVGKKLRIP